MFLSAETQIDADLGKGQRFTGQHENEESDEILTLPRS